MFCGNCGKELLDEEKACPNCGTMQKENTVSAEAIGAGPNMSEITSNAESVTGHVYVSPDEIRNKVNATLLLVLSIIEIIFCCCFSGFVGILPIVAIVLYFTMLDRDIKAGNLDSAKKSAKIIIILLSVAPILGIVLTIATFVLSFATGIIESIL